MKKRVESPSALAKAALRVYGQQSERIKEMVRKGRSSEEKIVFLSSAFATLFKDRDFVHLLAMETALSIPKLFQEWIAATEEDAS